MINHSLIASKGNYPVPDKEKRINLIPSEPTEVPLSPRLTAEQYPLVRASRFFPKAFECEKEQFFLELTKIITKAYKDTGFKYTEKDLAETCLSVAQDIYGSATLKNLTIAEIQIAISSGTRNEYKDFIGEYMGLSAVTFYKFLRFYATQLKHNAIQEQLKFEAEQEELAKKWEPNEEEKKIFDYYGIVGLINALDLSDEQFMDSKCFLYNRLKSIGMVSPPSEQEREEVTIQATNNLIEARKKAIKVESRNHRKTEMNEEIKKIREFGGDIVANEACRIFLKAKLSVLVDQLGKQDGSVIRIIGQRKLIEKVKQKLLPELTDDQLTWEAIRLRIKKVNELFDNSHKWDKFKEKNKRLMETKLPRP